MPDRHFTFTVTGSMEDRDDVALLRRIATPQAEPVTGPAPSPAADTITLHITRPHLTQTRWSSLVRDIRDLGFEVVLTGEAGVRTGRIAGEAGVPLEKIQAAMAPAPVSNEPDRGETAHRLLEAVLAALPVIHDEASGQLMRDLSERIDLYRLGGLKRKGAAEERPVAMAPAPGPRYTIDEAELKRRLHRPAQPGYNFGKPYDLPPTSGTGMEIRKALASETFKRELATVVAVRLEHPGQRVLGSLLDLLTFAANEGLI